MPWNWIKLHDTILKQNPNKRHLNSKSLWPNIVHHPTNHRTTDCRPVLSLVEWCEIFGQILVEFVFFFYLNFALLLKLLGIQTLIPVRMIIMIKHFLSTLSDVIYQYQKSVISYLLILVCCITVSFDNCIGQMIVAHFVLEQFSNFGLQRLFTSKSDILQVLSKFLF